jgi:large repetitive protein
MPTRRRWSWINSMRSRDGNHRVRRNWRALRGEPLEPRNLLSGTPALVPSAAGASLSAQPPVPSASVPAVQAQPQEPDLSVTGGTFVYDGFAHEAVGTALGEGDVIVEGTFSFTYNGSAAAPTNPGTYAVVATFISNDPNFTNGAANTTLIITQALPTITVTGGTFLFDFNPHPATATAIGSDGVTPVAGSYSFTYNGSATPPTGPGNYAVAASFTSSDPFYGNGSATGTITIPDPTIPGGVAVSGASTTSVSVSWNSVIEPSGGTPTYNVYERIFHPGHGGGRGGIVPSYYTYNLVASGLTTTSAIVSGLTAAPAGGTAKSHSYVVTSVLGGVESTRSAAATGAPLYAPSVGFFLYGGAVWSGSFPVNVTVGSTLQVSVQGYGNEPPTYSVASGPSCVSIDPHSGVISISPTAADVGTFTATFTATNSLGSATTASLAVHVLALPTVVVTGGAFAFDGSTHSATAVAYGSDGVTPLAGTFSFLYAPSFYPTALSTAPYAESGSYIVQATYTSSDPNYGNAVGTGSVVIAPAVPTLMVNDGAFVFDGTSHGATAIAVGIDGVTPISGTFQFTYGGSSAEPTAAGTYPVVATFVSSESDYSGAIGGGTIVIGATTTMPSTTITVGTTATYNLTGAAPTGGPAQIVNNSSADVGLFVTGANQVAGIDGTGNLAIGAGGSLIANHIIQNSLVIGGSAANPATVTIAASDSDGNPLASAAASSATASGFALSSAQSAVGQSTAVQAAAVRSEPPQSDIVSQPIAGPAKPSPAALTSAPETPHSSPPTDPAAKPSELVSSTSGLETREVASAAKARGDFGSWNQPSAAVDAVFEDHGVPTIVDDDLLDLIGSGIGKFAKE